MYRRKSGEKRGQPLRNDHPVLRIEYYNDGFPFGQTNLFVYFRNGNAPKETRWYIASRQSRNLLGPVTTLDDVDGPIDRQEGLLSCDGWYLINDTGKEILKTDGSPNATAAMYRICICLFTAMTTRQP